MKNLCINCARCNKVDKDGYIICPKFRQIEEAKAAGMNVFLHCFCSDYRSREAQGIEWSYSKVAYLLDIENVIWPMVALIKAANIWTADELLEAVLSGEAAMWPKATKRGYKDLFRVLRNQLNVDAKTLMEAAKLYK